MSDDEFAARMLTEQFAISWARPMADGSLIRHASLYPTDRLQTPILSAGARHLHEPE